MCGVLVIAIKNFNDKDHDLVRGLFIQSMIRGKHATGVSYVKNGKVITIKESIPAVDFINKQDLNEWRNEDGNLYCIGHIRYSTSDLRYNQPFATDSLGIVHNGVISQESRDTWLDTFGLETETANDSELILRALEKGETPLNKFHPASMAVCTIDSNKKITAFRNEERPLYYSYSNNAYLFASTADILKRAGITYVGKVPMYTIISLDNFEVSSYTIDVNVEDLQ
jgi:glutamine phosphoribosylpyrophosphate amidotransferase